MQIMTLEQFLAAPSVTYFDLSYYLQNSFDLSLFYSINLSSFHINNYIGAALSLNSARIKRSK